MGVYGRYKYLILSVRGSTIDVYRRQTLTSEVGPSAERVNLYFLIKNVYLSKTSLTRSPTEIESGNNGWSCKWWTQTRPPVAACVWIWRRVVHADAGLTIPGWDEVTASCISCKVNFGPRAWADIAVLADATGSSWGCQTQAAPWRSWTAAVQI